MGSGSKYNLIADTTRDKENPSNPPSSTQQNPVGSDKGGAVPEEKLEPNFKMIEEPSSENPSKTQKPDQHPPPNSHIREKAPKAIPDSGPKIKFPPAKPSFKGLSI
jgi:hypothetical protein